uniref:Uncharacterized protein n=2 Tax=Timema TaxID=61471 RepID=A0A7R9HMG3_9NEOP|nr:unnamed protein product [Timema cristinae]CAD7427895.1 unnamed protein product [Timema monikensis]
MSSWSNKGSRPFVRRPTTMLLTLSVFCSMCVMQSLSGIPREDKYTKRWDSIDLDQILHTDRLLEGYLRCLMEEGPCTPDAKDLKSEYQMRGGALSCV